MRSLRVKLAQGFLIVAFVARSPCSVFGQAGDSTEEVLRKSAVVAGNILTAITEHLESDPDFRLSKQLPENKRYPPNLLYKRDGSFEFDQTPGQNARSLMEDMRQGVHELQSAEKARGLDGIALAGAREYWPKLRDISCRESPGTRYYDLDGQEQYCPARP
jgi:hypothetical protein